MASDSQGYVANFFSLEALTQEVIAPFPETPLMVQRFPVDPAAPLDTVWVVLHREADTVAFASNSRAKASLYQAALLNVGKAYPDSPDYWMQSANSIQVFSLQRLKRGRAASSALELDPLLARSDAEMRDLLAGAFEGRGDAPEPISIFDFVEGPSPLAFPPPPPADPAAEAAAEAADRLQAAADPERFRRYCELEEARQAELLLARLRAESAPAPAGAEEAKAGEPAPPSPPPPGAEEAKAGEPAPLSPPSPIAGPDGDGALVFAFHPAEHTPSGTS